MQTKRELFFKGESGLTTSPTVPSVPPPQPPNAMSTTPAGATIIPTSTTTGAATIITATTTMTTTPVPSSTVPPVASVKPRLPSNMSVDQEDSNKRDSNKESALQIHLRPAALPSKPREPDGYVGFANLPNQVYRKAVKKGFEFTLMVVGMFYHFFFLNNH